MKGFKRKPIYGVGINDANYTNVANCKIYDTWKGMLRRCYREEELIKRPSYIGCSVIEEWHLFSNFRNWMLQQEYEGKSLDKDILFPGNKIYSKETCVFVKTALNSLFTLRGNDRGDMPLGVTKHKQSGKIDAIITINGKVKFLGRFQPDQVNLAETTYLKAKIEIINDAITNLDYGEYDNKRLEEGLNRWINIFKERIQEIN